eukprot:6234070-Prymnesium_polylepis.1
MGATWGHVRCHVRGVTWGRHTEDLERAVLLSAEHLDDLLRALRGDAAAAALEPPQRLVVRKHLEQVLQARVADGRVLQVELLRGAAACAVLGRSCAV